MAFLLDMAPTLVLLLAAGAIAGLLAGLFGLGGGLVVVPVVFFLMRGQGLDASTAMPIAATTSLATIVPTAMASARAHHKLDNIDWPLVRSLAPALLTGVLFGGQLVAHLRTPAFAVFFGLFLLFIALNSLLRGHREARLAALPGLWWRSAIACGVGVVSAIAGVGGGAMGVPLLTAASVPIHRAIGCCAAFGLLIAAVGAVSIALTSATPADAPPGTWKLIYLPAIAVLVPLTVFMAPYGARLGKRLPARLLRLVFAAILVLVSGRMLYAAWAG